MPGQAAKVVITERQQPILWELSKSRTESQSVAQRATIVLRAFEKQRNAAIAAEIGLGAGQVGVWRRRWQAAWAELTALECREPRKLRAAICEVLRDAPRAGSPGTFTPEQITQILALACEPPEKSQRPITHWTRRELRDEVLKRGIVPSISESQVGRFLKRAALQSWPARPSPAPSARRGPNRTSSPISNKLWRPIRRRSGCSWLIA